MKILERIRLVQFFLFDQQEIKLGETTGIFGPNGSGKSSLLDAVQIAMLGGNSRRVALNAQADEQVTTRSLRAYCLGQYGENPEHRARNEATTYITLIWRNTVTNMPISMGVCIQASAERDGHEVRGRYILPEVELTLGDHLEVVDGEPRPRAWETFRHQLIERSRASGQDPLYPDSDRYIQAALLALRASSGPAPSPDAFTRAFRFALRMRFDKSVDQIVRNDVLEARPTNIKKFKEITDSFRRLANQVAKVQAQIADGEKVNAEYEKAVHESRRALTWNALSKTAAAEVANEAMERASLATENARQALQDFKDREITLEREANEARALAARAREQRESHASHKDYGGLQAAIQKANARAQSKHAEITSNIVLVRRRLGAAAQSEFLKAQSTDLQAAAQGLEPLLGQLAEGTATQEMVISALRPAIKQADKAFLGLMGHGGELKRALKDAREELELAKDNQNRVIDGKAQLSDPTRKLLRELGEKGVQAVPVCDLVRITDTQWQPVIESYLGRNLEALLVNDGQEKAAFSIYRGLTGSREIFSAKIAMASRQPTGRRSEPGTVASLIAGENLAAVAYLQQKLGDRRCASTDDEAMDGRRTLTKDGMMVSDGEMERLRPIEAKYFKIGAASPHLRNLLQQEVARLLARINALEIQEKALDSLLSDLRIITHEDTVLKSVADVWSALTEAQQEVADKTELLNDAADEDYVRLGAEESEATKLAVAAEGQLRLVAEQIGGARKQKEECEAREGIIKREMEAAHEAATEARQNPEVDKDFEARQWDALLDRFSYAYPAMVKHSTEQEDLCRTRMSRAVSAGTAQLYTFLGGHQIHCPSEVATEWLAAHAWLKDLLKNLHDTKLVPYKEQMDDANRASQEIFRNDVAIALNNNLEWLNDTRNRLNAVLRACPTFSNGERYQFRQTVRPQLETALKYVKDVAAHGPTGDLFGGPGEIPEEFRALLDDKLANNARSPLDDYREFFEFDIEIQREDPETGVPKVVGHLSKRLGPGSGGEHRAPLYVIAGAALASAYRLDRGQKDGIRLMLLDEAFNKMDMTNIIATMRYLEDLGLQVFMASPGENQGILDAFLHRYYDIVRDVDNNAVMLEGRDVLPETRELMRSDLPEFNPGLIEEEIAAMRSALIPVRTAEAVSSGSQGA